MENIVGFFGSILIILALLLFTVILVFAIFGFVVGIMEVFNDFKTINNNQNKNKNKKKKKSS